MAMDLAELVAMRHALVASRAKGVRRVRMRDEEVEYNSDREVASAIADLEARI
jgi:hypothetical protein